MESQLEVDGFSVGAPKTPVPPSRKGWHAWPVAALFSGKRKADKHPTYACRSGQWMTGCPRLVSDGTKWMRWTQACVFLYWHTGTSTVSLYLSRTLGDMGPRATGPACGPGPWPLHAAVWVNPRMSHRPLPLPTNCLPRGNLYLVRSAPGQLRQFLLSQA